MSVTFNDLLKAAQNEVGEIFPWDLVEKQQDVRDLLVLDVREPAEFEAMHIAGSINVPRGVLECATEYGYQETSPELVVARKRDIVVVCRSGNRSLLAALTMQVLGYEKVCSMRTGLKGWNDYEQPLVDGRGSAVSIESAEDFFTPRLSAEQSGSRDVGEAHPPHGLSGKNDTRQ